MSLPAPLVSAEVDLTDFQYMELDVRLLRDSKFAAEVDAEAFRAGVLLWCAAWHQVPAASLPDNDLELSQLAGYGRVVKEWKKVREQALSLFVLCSDGRLYHRVIAEKAVAAWQSKLRHQHGKLLERLRKENKRREAEKLPALPLPSFEQWNSERVPAESQPPSAGIPPENALRGNRTEQNGEGTERNSLLSSDPGGSGAGAPPNSADVIFGLGVPALTAAGVSDSAARSMLGLMRKTHGDDALIAALQRCAEEQPLQPVAWLQAALKSKPKPTREQAARDFNVKANADAKRLLGIGEIHA